MRRRRARPPADAPALPRSILPPRRRLTPAIPSPLAPHCAGGGGGIGIHICRSEDEVVENFKSAARQGAASFGDAGVFVEKYVQVRQGAAWC